MMTIQEHSTSVWKTAESDKVMTNPARRETKDETKGECVVAKVTHMIEGKPLGLLQVNCRSIHSKTLDFWNLIDTHNPGVVIGTESWLFHTIFGSLPFTCITIISYTSSTHSSMQVMQSFTETPHHNEFFCLF